MVRGNMTPAQHAALVTRIARLEQRHRYASDRAASLWRDLWKADTAWRAADKIRRKWAARLIEAREELEGATP